MYEHRKQPLISRTRFFQRIIGNLLFALLVMFFCLAIGVAGYHFTENIPWLDSLHQASMILSGMGPIITDFHTIGGKIFSSAYALFSGIVFISLVGYILAPAVHRIFHKLHIESNLG